MSVEYSGRDKVRFLIFSASLGSESLNTRPASLAAQCISARGGEVDLASMAQFDAPSFDSDRLLETGFPPGAREFAERLRSTGAFVISSPEHNASRFTPQPFNECHALLMSASPSIVGGNRGLWALRVPFEHLGARSIQT